MIRKTTLRELPVKQLENNPWCFRIMYEKDFVSLVKSIKGNGIDIILPPIVAKIEKKYYVVDGHSRIKAAKKAGIKKITCKVLGTIKNFADLRVNSFRYNKDGYTNPLQLSDMFYEDLQSLGSIKDVATIYNVNEKYVQSLVKIKNLHDDTKSIINKIIESAKRKYQFVLNQITPEHLSALSELSPDRQIQVVDWIFRDIMYGPADESMVSVPSIYEIIEEISQIEQNKEKKHYKKHTRTNQNEKPKEIPIMCRCGAKYEINVKSNSIYEYIEQNNVIVKKKFDGEITDNVFSSKFYTKDELIKMITKSDNEVRIIISKGT